MRDHALHPQRSRQRRPRRRPDRGVRSLLRAGADAALPGALPGDAEPVPSRAARAGRLPRGVRAVGPRAADGLAAGIPVPDRPEPVPEPPAVAGHRVRHIVHATPFPDPAELVQKPGRPRKGRSPRSRQGKREAVVLVEWLWMDQEEAATAPWGSGRDRFGPGFSRQGSTGGTERRRSRYRARGTGSVPGDVGAEERDHVRHRGEYLELTLPDLPVEGGDFSRCVDGSFSIRVAPIDVAEGEGGRSTATTPSPSRSPGFSTLKAPVC